MVYWMLPHYTKPAQFREHVVPDELTSGNHALIKQWRTKMAFEKTQRLRPDLLSNNPQLIAEHSFSIRNKNSEEIFCTATPAYVQVGSEPHSTIVLVHGF